MHDFVARPTTIDPILEQAALAVDVNRQAEHGDPLVNWDAIAEIFNVVMARKYGSLVAIKFTADDMLIAMQAMKLVRSTNGYNEDNHVDMAGYAAIRNRAQSRGQK